jgi:hypothetical protein
LRIANCELRIANCELRIARSIVRLLSNTCNLHTCNLHTCPAIRNSQFRLHLPPDGFGYGTQFLHESGKAFEGEALGAVAHGFGWIWMYF